MKIRTLIPAIIALVILVGGPFGFGPLHEEDPTGGLICYCCLDKGEHCAMISCSGCCGAHHAGFTADRWSPEMIPEAVPTLAPLYASTGTEEEIRLPETVYAEVPDKPPETV